MSPTLQRRRTRCLIWLHVTERFFGSLMLTKSVLQAMDRL